MTFFDCLHDMGDPVGAARHVRQTLKPDGRWMIVEPAAGDRAGRQSQSGRPALLRGLDDDLRPDLPRPTGGAALGAQAVSQAVVGHQRRRFRPGTQGDRDAVQHDPGGKTLKRDASHLDCAARFSRVADAARLMCRSSKN